jgi:hypothetical protein
MGCNCKADKNTPNYNGDEENVNVNIPKTIGNYILKTIGFLLFIIALPVVNVLIIGYVFNILILNKNVDLKPVLFSILSKFKVKDDEDDEDDEDEDYYHLTEDDVEMEGVEEIIYQAK